MDFYTQKAVESVSGAAIKIFAEKATSASPKVDMDQKRKDQIDPPAGVELESYINRYPSEDGTYIIVKEHVEWVQGIPQPLTEAEILAYQQRREADNVRLAEQSKIALGIGLAAVSTAGILYLFRDKLFN